MNKVNVKLLLSLFIPLLMGSCYNDMGGNDFDTVLPDVSIVIPAEAYSTGIGSQITIVPEIKTDIDTTDLKYYWEVRSDSTNERGSKIFRSLVPDSQQGKILHYTGKLDANISVLNNSYPCRLRVHQVSTGRDFYSASTFTITLSGITGLMILHGDNSGTEIGMLQDGDFTPAAMSIPATPVVVPDLYSSSNGSKLPGAPLSITQTVTNYISAYGAYYPSLNERCGKILTLSSNGATWINKDGFERLGGWNTAFYAQGSEAVNQNKPKGIFAYQLYLYAFDGTDVFIQSPLQQKYFLFAEVTDSTVYADKNTYTFEPQFITTTGGTYPIMMYANSVNGDKTHKGFFGLRTGNPGYMTRYGMILDSKNDPAVFNPGNMHADIVKMAWDGRRHVLAVLKGVAANVLYPDKFFAVDLNPSATPVAGSVTAYSGIGQYLYNLSALPNIDNAVAFEFGTTSNMCYYAAGSKVYQYNCDAGNIGSPRELGMIDGSSWDPKGTVTMMKMLDNSQNTPTHNTKEAILMVAAYQGSNAVLWALHMDTMTGRISKAVEYSAATVPDWKFGPIKDIYIKAM